MSTTLEQSVLTTWEDFLELPDPEDGFYYELHDGEVVVVSPAAPIHLFVERMMAKWLNAAADGRGDAFQEFPYRPAANLHYWRADVAYIPNQDWTMMLTSNYPIYAPPFIAEVLSPSNRPRKIERQRLAAFAGGTREFWVIDPVRKTIEVSIPGHASQIYAAGEDVPLKVIPGALLQLGQLFEE